ncbi:MULTISPECIES: metallophosphoesterase family protein [Desulfococcus]|uniref:Metallophosphoesterase n=1 Tax=Desulfococcus multivorans DSM 2059 TaxID=1121405 RepID=S7TWB0_DESML|nr:metallophosphoesterase [Desulfococcus multivorans]AOY58115.1 metallophosphoesterase [Desulfococcus multivorans]EPR41316.1 metallophosphoesterase [Desulfococcus multivorans DSM 2059]MDX9818306.1 metallophosphoesterase [Desulfococcus multivorans]SJZ73000.1 3',5'-cyclic AMP phosphodiesterase CpdA [Desulfococcus multivorans DSM 2059]
MPLYDPPPAQDDSRTDIGLVARTRFLLAHVSDPHMAWRCRVSWRDLIGKRILGYLGWRLRRCAEHREEILTALREDLARIAPDHIAVTGDLTHLGLSQEFENARRWLERLGDPSQVTVVPGNHDAYTGADRHRGFVLWQSYMASDDSHPPERWAGSPNLFPTVRLRGSVLLIGVNTAHPTPPHLATGTIGNFQLRRLESILKAAAGRRLFRVILIHHPPLADIVSHRKRLTDASALQCLIGRYGIEMILHGHSHKHTHRILKTASGTTLVAGMPSASALGRTPERRARYAIHDIRPVCGGWQVVTTERVYAAVGNYFFTEAHRCMHMASSKH